MYGDSILKGDHPQVTTAEFIYLPPESPATAGLLRAPEGTLDDLNAPRWLDVGPVPADAALKVWGVGVA